MALENPGNALFHLLDRLGIDDEVDAFANLLYQFERKKKPDTHTLIPGSFETLDRFHQRYLMAIVSSRGERKTRDFLEHYNLSHFFHCVATSQTCPRSKPYPHPILWAAGRMGVAPQECLMVGDTPVDIRAGLAAGTQTAGVLSGFGERDELIHAGAHVILPTAACLQDILRE
jgi:HAD superfamily hydrolase (TIGR01549 family)